MERAMTMERTQSMSSYGMKTDASKNSRAVTNTNSADRAQERELMALRRQLQQHRQHDDAASDTSSQRERKFANLLGASDTSSDRNLSPTNRNIGHRLYYTGCGRERVKQERLREERERLLMHEMSKLTQRPNITARARSKPSKGQHFADHAAMWSAQRDHHLRRTAQQVAAERFSEVREKPQLNPRSEAIVKNSGDYKGPVRHWDAHFEKFSAKHMGDNSPPPSSFTPNINANAVRVDVERSISERLFEEAASRQIRAEQKVHERQARELVDPATGRNFFEPHSLRVSQTTDKRTPEEVSFTLHEESYEVARRRKMAEEHHPDLNFAFKPTINEVSATIAADKRKPLYVPRAQRLKEEQEKRERIQQRSRSSEQSPRPTTSPINVDDFLRRAQHNELVREQKLAAILREQKSRELNECTFHPAITRKSEEIFSLSNVSGTPMSATDVLSPVPNTERTHFSSASRAHHTDAVSTPHSPYNGTQSSPPKSLSARAGRGTAADDFAAVMAASGLSNAHQFVSTPSSAAGGRRGPRPGEGSPNASMAAQPSHSAEISMGKPTTPRGVSQPAGGSGGMGDVDQYIAAFESQMYSVLEEWRKLEEV